MLNWLIGSIILNFILGTTAYYCYDTVKSVKKQAKAAEEEAQLNIEKIKEDAKEAIKKALSVKQKAMEKEKQSQQQKDELQVNTQKALKKLLQINENCIKSHVLTLQALKSKYVKITDLNTAREKLEQKTKNKLLRRFEKFEKELLKEVEGSKITQETIEDAFTELRHNQ